VSAKRQSLCVAFFVFQFLLVAAVSLHATFILFKTHVVSWPSMSGTLFEKLDQLPAALVPNEASSVNFGQKLLATYTNAAGIEAGYGYFAPNIPAESSLVFEFHDANGKVKYGAPTVATEAGSLRLQTLLAQAASAELPEWREELVKLLANSSRRFHPDAISVRAFFGSLSPPDLNQYKAGKREMVFNCRYVYDFKYSTDTGVDRARATKATSLSLPR
jgi:hypothetical protein